MDHLTKQNSPEKKLCAVNNTNSGTATESSHKNDLDSAAVLAVENSTVISKISNKFESISTPVTPVDAPCSISFIQSYETNVSALHQNKSKVKSSDSHILSSLPLYRKNKMPILPAFSQTFLPKYTSSQFLTSPKETEDKKFLSISNETNIKKKNNDLKGEKKVKESGT